MILRQKSTGAVVQLASKSIGFGGEAQNYPVTTDPRLVAKIYHNPTAIHSQKLAVMIAQAWSGAAKPSSHHMIAWPQELLITNDKRAKVVGFLMWRATGVFPIHMFYTPQSRRMVCPMFNHRYLLRIAWNYAAVVNTAHHRGYVIGDINESGALA
jgi:DNA-binding helix-hairpin-helix protein with protein kinase domain